MFITDSEKRNMMHIIEITCLYAILVSSISMFKNCSIFTETKMKIFEKNLTNRHQSMLVNNKNLNRLKTFKVSARKLSTKHSLSSRCNLHFKEVSNRIWNFRR